MVYDRIFLCLEGISNETHLIREAMRVGLALNASLTVVHINDPHAGKPLLLMDSLPRITRDDMVRMFEEAGYGDAAGGLTFRVMDDDAYSDTIVNLSREADLLIMGHRHHSRLMGALINSTDEQVADRVSCPILLVPLE
ncbi:MAG TPA: universal stress protein [bacterium]|nr:universal stress protein [bacterium]